MSFFISDALAVGAAEEQNLLTGMLPLIIIFILFWFLLIRPQTKRAKEHKQMVAAIAKGDEIVTNGGVLGKITGVDDSFISLEISNGVIVKVQRQAVAAIMPKGTMPKGTLAKPKANAPKGSKSKETAVKEIESKDTPES